MQFQTVKQTIQLCGVQAPKLTIKTSPRQTVRLTSSGAPGPQGNPGAPGAIGPTGPAGPAGAKGQNSILAARGITASGDIDWSVSFDGTTDAASTATLSNVNATPGQVGSATAVPVLTIDAKGRVTAMSSVTLGNAASRNIGATGATVPLLNGTNYWSAPQTFGSKIYTVSSGGSGSGFNMAQGARPTSPANGDLWTTYEGLYTYLNGNDRSVVFQEKAATFFAKLTFQASKTTAASITIPVGVKPTTPVAGDMWATAAGLFWNSSTTARQVLFTDSPEIVGATLIVSRVADAAGPTSSFQTLSDGVASTVALNAAPMLDTMGGFDRATGHYTIPQTGLYDVRAKLRLSDSTRGGLAYGIGLDIVSQDGPHVQWAVTTAATGLSSGNGRHGALNSRYVTLTAGDKFRMFAITSGDSAGILSAEFSLRKVG